MTLEQFESKHEVKAGHVEDVVCRTLPYTLTGNAREDACSLEDYRVFMVSEVDGVLYLCERDSVLANQPVTAS